ncbi:MAG: hypothetical protein II399_04450 [Lachnospiraceae bacterium]|nr:hypothetical protein [Lachnospiraceae bacterium]
MIPNLLLIQISPFSIVMMSITLVLLIAVIVLFFVGKRMDKKQAEQQKQIDAARQNMTMLIIDKKRVRFKDAGFPQSVVDQAPKMTRLLKVPVVKAKVGPQIVILIADDKIFDSIPVKKEVKAVVSGMYIVSVRLAHGKQELQPVKKKNFFKRTVEKLQEKAGAKPISKK